MKINILLLFIITCLIMILINQVSACSCAMSGTPTEELKNSDAVFSGKVIDIDTPFFPKSSAAPVKITFEVSTVWEGTPYKIITVTTELDEASCGYPFKEGKEYIVYAYGNVTELKTNICKRTNLLSNAQEDLAELGEGKTPNIENPNSPEESDIIQILLFICGAIILLIIIFFVINKYQR